jgi:hypothetical protein
MIKGTKLSEETKEKIRMSKLGKKRKPFTQEHKDRIRIGHKGIKHTDVSKKNMSNGRIGMKFSEEHKKNLSKSHKGISRPKGKKSPNWKGGITPLVKILRNCFKYRLWRNDVFTRDNFTCQECGIRGRYLEAHHIKEFSKIIHEYNIKTLDDAENCEELWDINNGRTLCFECHNKTKKGRKTIINNNKRK